MAKYIAHASIDERGKISGGSAGDQTGKEVCIRTWYSKPWNYLLKIKDAKVRKQFGNNMIALAKNNKVGYDQSQRNTLLTQAEKVKFDFSKISTMCECDCSSAITICLLGAIYLIHGKSAYEKAKSVLVNSGNCATTSTLRSALTKLDMIVAHNGKDYIGGTSKADFGDIFIKEGSHVVCYVNDGKSVKVNPIAVKVESAESKSSKYNKTYTTTANLNLRSGAGTSKDILVTMPKGTKVKCAGKYTKVKDTVWLLVETIVSGTKYTGFCSKDYLS